MGTIIDFKTRKAYEGTEPLVRVFENIAKKEQALLPEHGCLIKRVKNDPEVTKIHCQKTVWQVTFPAGTREEIKEADYGYYRIYFLPDGEIYSEYKQGTERASLLHTPYYDEQSL